MKKKINKKIVLREDDFRKNGDHGGSMFHDLIVEELGLPKETEEVTLWVSHVEADLLFR